MQIPRRQRFDADQHRDRRVGLHGMRRQGGDVLAYELAATGADFVEAAKAIGAWVDDGRPEARHKATPLPARQAMQVLAFEATLTAIAAGNIANGVLLTAQDRSR